MKAASQGFPFAIQTALERFTIRTKSVAGTLTLSLVAAYVIRETGANVSTE
jgi:hypothetical protein